MANGVDSLSRDLANISIAPGAPTAAPASTLLVPPPPAWEVPAPHAIEGAIPATPDLPLVGQEEQVIPWQDMTRAGGEPSMLHRIPFQPSFDTISITRLYGGLPFPSGCLDSKEENAHTIHEFDGKVRTDKTYPTGFMGMPISLLMHKDTYTAILVADLWCHFFGRCHFHPLKLCKVRSVQFGQKGIPYLNTYNGRTIRYPDPLIKANDTIKIDLENNKIMDFFKFDIGNVVMVTGGRNTRCVGVIKNWEKHKGSFEVIDVQLGAFCYV
eukprot:XP_020407667.1 40S ribosomal protein S4 [Zea mays]